MGRGRNNIQNQIDSSAVLFSSRFSSREVDLKEELRTTLAFLENGNSIELVWSKIDELSANTKKELINTRYDDLILDPFFKKLYLSFERAYVLKFSEYDKIIGDQDKIFLRFFFYSFKENLFKSLEGKGMKPVFFNRPLLYLEYSDKTDYFSISLAELPSALNGMRKQDRKKEIFEEQLIPALSDNSILLEETKEDTSTRFAFTDDSRKAAIKTVSQFLFTDGQLTKDQRIASIVDTEDICEVLSMPEKSSYDRFTDIFNPAKIETEVVEAIFSLAKTEKEYLTFEEAAKKAELKEAITVDTFLAKYELAKTKEMTRAFLLSKIYTRDSYDSYDDPDFEQLFEKEMKTYSNQEILERLKPLYINDENILGEDDESKRAWSKMESLFESEAERLSAKDLKDFFTTIVLYISLKEWEILENDPQRSSIFQDIKYTFNKLVSPRSV